ncbi:CHRD domain-containing protein [Microlunatus panaciterrae]|uniref:CHRD domain-containing protein n=1 Tax=Microlunatus panaciterrae TaxID=400768 RepID=A0ABS2RM30_9ACTN|nr:CHRD domain-containing protein [Microlunatus panaciterrae]MBM7800060.1 hypothetical protein [Microlunatus panaciterrae]
MTTTESRFAALRHNGVWRRSVALAAIATISIGATVPAYADGGHHRHSNKTLHATLTGAKEVPGPGDANGRGKATVKLRQHKICFTLTWRRIDAPTAAHIHAGKAGVAGPVVVQLLSVPGGLGAPVNRVGGCTEVDPALVKKIRKDPRSYYVNIHNKDFPSGAIRGQLH